MVHYRDGQYFTRLLSPEVVAVLNHENAIVRGAMEDAVRAECEFGCRKFGKGKYAAFPRFGSKRVALIVGSL